MPANVTYEWHPQAITRIAMRHGEALAERKAAEMVAVADPPVDTGFLRASGYVNGSLGYSTFDQRWRDGMYLSRHSGLMVRRVGGSDMPVPPPKHGAIAGWNAPYAIFVEERTGFIYGALLRVAARK